MGIRVLHVLDKISAGSGVSAVVMNYYAKLDHDKLTFDFMLNEDPDAQTRAYIQSGGSKIFIMPALKTANLLKYIKSLRAFYKKHSYKIIHGHAANSAVFYLGLAKNVPHRIIHSHSIKSSDIWWKRIRNWFLTRFIKCAANNYIACSDKAAKFLFGKTEGVTIIQNAIDTDKFSYDSEKRNETRSSLGLGDNFVIGHVGRFAAVKNHSFLLDVFNEVYKNNTNARLMLIGDGELLDAAVQKARKLGLGDAVLFIGETSDAGAYMSAMDVLALPSLFEGLGMAGVEAQASGLKVLASENVPRAMDITGNVGFLKLDKAVWVRALAGLPPVGDRLEQGSKVRGTRFDIGTQAELLCGYYEKLLTNV